MLRQFVRIRRYVERNAARLLFQRPLEIDIDRAVISFTFDDFPRSALQIGGAILRKHGFSGTYYTALGLLGSDSPSGEIAGASDLRTALHEGHELGCHTFSHCHSWKTRTGTFEASVLRNRSALAELVPGTGFNTFSYPISEPRPLTKRAMSKYFLCCRAGGQRFNRDKTDLNQLSAYFLERASGDFQAVRELIDGNCKARGWLIFATHDISPSPSPFGCTPEFFQDVVGYAADSGALVLPVVEALEKILNSRRSQ